MDHFNQKSLLEIAGRTLEEVRKIADGGYGSVILVQDVRSKETFVVKKSFCQNEERYAVASSELNFFVV